MARDDTTAGTINTILA